MTLAAPRIERPSRGRIVRGALFGCAAVALFFAPAVVARIVTSSANEPISFVSAPWRAWAFTGSVLAASLTAQAASPGEALTRATTELGPAVAGKTPLATAVDLIYLPGHRTVRVADALGRAHVVDPPHSLVWLVSGRLSSKTRVVPIGLLDFQSGNFVAEWITTPKAKEAA